MTNAFQRHEAAVLWAESNFKEATPERCARFADAYIAYLDFAREQGDAVAHITPDVFARAAEYDREWFEA